MFRKIKGQNQVIGLLSSAIINNRISQAYLFHGGDGVGKFITALYFGMALNCLSSSEYRPCGVCASCRKFLALEHPDFHYLFPTTNLKLSPDGEIKEPEGLAQYSAYIQNKKDSPWAEFYFNGSTEIRKESITLLMKRLDLSIHEGEYRVVIIENADMMNTSTANAFLKTLEEPPDQTVIILITERLPQLLPTIVSRCQPVYFKPLSQAVIQEILFDQFAVDTVLAKSAARISGGNLKMAIRVAQDSSNTSRIKAFEMLDLAARDAGLEYLAMTTKGKESKDQVSDLISYLGIIVNDLAIVRYAPGEITNLDKTELLCSLADDAVTERVPGFLLLLDDYNRKLGGNVNPGILQLNLFLSLRNLLRKSS